MSATRSAPDLRAMYGATHDSTTPGPHPSHVGSSRAWRRVSSSTYGHGMTRERWNSWPARTDRLGSLPAPALTVPLPTSGVTR
jgi:hypothetical protein